MKFDISMFDLAFKSKKIKKIPLLIYGAGSTGSDVSKFLSRMGFEVLAFIDKKYDLQHKCENRPVMAIEEAFKEFGADIQILIAIHNRGVDMVDVIHALEKTGFRKIFTMFDYACQFPDDKTFRYFLTDPVNLAAEKFNAEKFYNLLEDQVSRDLYSSLIKFRLSGDYRNCPKPSLKSQYSPPDIPRWKNPLRLVDCGAYDGDSINLLKSYGYDFELIIALEPDQNNYQKIIQNINIPNSIFLPCGVSSSAKSMRFDAGNGEGSRASHDGTITIQMLSIDEAFPSVKPNLIKMDIEGGEREALLGAKETMQKFRPGIALSSYHLPYDLWELGLLIYEINPEYRFYMRTHGYSSFETVLYAIPKP